MAEWEYKIVELSKKGLFDSPQPTEAELNELGERGWELATALTKSKTGLSGRPSGRTNKLVFKRPK
ncbi:DUF4177 domain-containing protein [Halorubrum sp. AS12]|uniref:DUF4177 domain-containing protein n=1 Tax=Halorubrum sp. AS12 TaxID=3409687 RepID=UPI003DA7A6AA